MFLPISLKPQEFDDIVTSGKPVQVKITFDTQNVVFTEDDISADGGIQITSYQNPNTNIAFGAITSKEIIINFINSSRFNGFDWTDRLTVEFGIDYVENGITYTDWVQIGYFWGSKPKIYQGTDIIQFVAHDIIAKCDKNKIANDLESTLAVYGYPLSYQDLFYEVANGIGVYQGAYPDFLQFFYNHQLDHYVFNKGITYGQIIQWLAECNASDIVQRFGGATFRTFSKPTQTVLYGDYRVKYANCYNLQIEDMQIPEYDGIAILSSDNVTPDYYSAQSTNPYKFIDNPILLNLSSADKDALALELVQRIQEIGSYKPTFVEMEGGLCVEPGDIIKVEYDEAGNFMWTPVFKTTLYWNGQCRCIYECTGDESTDLTNEQLYNYAENGKINEIIQSRIANNLTTTDPNFVLDARQGKALDDNKFDKANVYNGLDKTASGFALDARQGKALNDKVSNIYNLAKAGSNSYSITVPSGSQHFIVITTNNSEIMYCGVLNVTSVGVISAKEIAKGTNCTVTFSTNTLTFAFTGANRTINIEDIVMSGNAIS